MNVQKPTVITPQQFIAWIGHYTKSRQKTADLLDVSLRQVLLLQSGLSNGNRKSVISRTTALSLAFIAELFKSGMSYEDVLNFVSNIDKCIDEQMEE